MKPTIAAGFLSLLDVWVNFSCLNDFARFARNYKGTLSKHVKEGYKTIRAGRGDEVSINGETKEAQKLVEAAKKLGANIKCTLGGNGGHEAAALKALGSNVIFIGAVSPDQIAKLSLESRKFFEGVDFSFARISRGYSPSGYILQAQGTNRYVLSEGRGRRINQLRSYLQNLPNALTRIRDRYGRLDMVNLVGWHGLFANGISNKDFRLVEEMIRKIRNEVSSPLFTDAGSLAAFDKRERFRICRIYSLFDILSMNEDEMLQISQVIGGGAKDEFRAMHSVLEFLERPSTIWLHSLDHQASLSTRYGRELLREAQVTAAAAGVYKVEKGTYPTIRELTRRRKIKNYSKKGLEVAKHASKKYGGKIGGAVLVVTPCYNARDFTSTVGAGDVAAAAYTYTIASEEV